MSSAGPPPGWYPDPAGGRGMRFWDGMGWTRDVTQPLGPFTPASLVDEETPARWARGALLVAPAAQVAATALMRTHLRHMLDHIRDVANGAATPAPTVHGAATVAGQVLGSLTAVTGVLFLIWFARSARNARALGLPARRSPAAAVAGFVMPVINLWWPYQSTCDLLPDDRANRSMVLRWFLLWMVGGFVGGIVGFAAAFVDSRLGWALLLVPAVLAMLASLAARQVVSAVVAVHAALAARAGMAVGPG